MFGGAVFTTIAVAVGLALSGNASDGTDDVILRATGSFVNFDGFLTLYKEDESDDEEAENEQDRRLAVGQPAADSAT